MATITVTQARYLGNKFGNPPICAGGPERPNFKETASQTYKLGEPVMLDSNGTVAIATATSNILDAGLCGIALEDATGTTGAQARARLIIPGDRYVMNVQGTSTDTTALTQVGDKLMLDLDGSKLVVNPDASFDEDKPYVIVEALYTVVGGYGDGDVVGDTNGRLVVWFPSQEGIRN